MKIFDLYNRQSLAHVIIDPQINYAWSKPSTRAVTENLIGAVNALKLPTIIVYMDHLGLGPENACGGIVPELLARADKIIPKAHNNAFISSALDRILKEHSAESFIASGFNIEACVAETTRGGQTNNYHVGILSDCVGSTFLNTRDVKTTLKRLQRGGINTLTTADFLP